MPQDEPPAADRLTLLLQDAADGAAERRTSAFAGIYAELRQIARNQLGRERSGHTLQPTALVHEAWVRLVGHGQGFATSAEFLAAAASAMRHVLVDHARSRVRLKRGGGRRKVQLDALALATAGDTDEVLAVDEAVTDLEARDPRLAEQVKLRLYAGLDDADIAAALAVSERTVRRDWLLARAFLHRRLAES